jgi:hypothetical protein
MEKEKLASIGRAYLKNHPEIVRRRNEAIRKAYKVNRIFKEYQPALSYSN